MFCRPIACMNCECNDVDVWPGVGVDQRSNKYFSNLRSLTQYN